MQDGWVFHQVGQGAMRLIVVGHWCSRYAADYKEKEKLHHRF